MGFHDTPSHKATPYTMSKTWSTWSPASGLPIDEINEEALTAFVYSPVSKEMIAYVANAARQVISCDPHLKPQEVQPAASRPVMRQTAGLPSLEEFITQLVISSNVHTSTLMSTLVYLRRLKSSLAPIAKGLRCTTHRIFLAALILAAKYLNDSSPKNKHWATYSVITTPDVGAFGFSKTEVNLMEVQLLSLLNYNLLFENADLYRELESFIHPLRLKIDAKHVRIQRKDLEYKLQQKQIQELQEQQYRMAMAASAAAAMPTPPSSRGSSRTRQSEATIRYVRDPATPDSLTYSASTASSSSFLSSRPNSREATPLDDPSSDYIYIANADYPSPDNYGGSMGDKYMSSRKNSRLPYEISEAEMLEMEGVKGSKRQRLWGRILGAAN